MQITLNFEASRKPALAINSFQYPANTVNLFLMVLQEECTLQYAHMGSLMQKEVKGFIIFLVIAKNLIAIKCH